MKVVARIFVRSLSGIKCRNTEFFLGCIFLQSKYGNLRIRISGICRLFSRSEYSWNILCKNLDFWRTQEGDIQNFTQWGECAQSPQVGKTQEISISFRNHLNGNNDFSDSIFCTFQHLTFSNIFYFQAVTLSDCFGSIPASNGNYMFKS